MTRFKCANCGFVFDLNEQQQQINQESKVCPKCGSNAVDIMENR